MTSLVYLVWWLAPFVASAVLTAVLLHRAKRLEWLDYPSSRSSHPIATPSRGGIGFVVVIVIAMYSSHPLIATLGGGSVWWILSTSMSVAVVGLIDDIQPLPVAPRLVVQIFAAGVALWAMGGVKDIVASEWVSPIPQLAYVLVVLCWVWAINLFNFMDGIDGIAGAEGVFVGIVGGVLSLLAGDMALAKLWFSLSGAMCGFLVFNWAPARIFMGDVGSGFLGFMIALLLLLSVKRGVLTLVSAALLIGPFLTDTTLTLARRIFRGDRWYEGHRTHAYQWLARRWGSHGRVALGAVFLNAIVVAPAIWFAAEIPDLEGVVAVSVFALLVGIGVWGGSGRAETSKKLENL